ncbi:hypothetical protein PHMEG_00031363, partial [Phytophthora megakarya]
IVKDYFSAFENGYKEASSEQVTPSQVAQRDFLQHRLTSSKEAGDETTAKYVENRWRVLSDCFEVFSFQQQGLESIKSDQRDMFLIEVSAKYILRITDHTIVSVFPHLVPNQQLVKKLVGKAIMVPAQINVSVEKSSRRISQIDEKMDFAAGLAELLPDSTELSVAISGAFLTQDGVDFNRAAARA